MEFRLNKIDTDARQRINEETSEGRIHAKKGILINQNQGDKKREQGKQKKKPEETFSISKYTSDKKKVSIEAVKVENVNVSAEKEDSGNNSTEYKGLYIDIRR